MKKRRLCRNYETINGQRIIIPSRCTRAREVQFTEKGKEIASESLLNELPRRIDVLLDRKVGKVLVVDAVGYLTARFEINAAFFHWLSHIEKTKLPTDLRKLGKEISGKKKIFRSITF